MAKSLPLPVLAFLLFLSFAAGTAKAQSPQTKKDAQIPLAKALKDVSKMYDTKFVYEKSLVEGKTTSYDIDDMKGKKVEEVLKSLLYPKGLLFLYIKQN